MPLVPCATSQVRHVCCYTADILAMYLTQTLENAVGIEYRGGFLQASTMRVSPRLSLSTQESGNGDGHNHAMPQRSRRREAAHLTSLLYNLHLMLMHRKRCAPPVYACCVTSTSTLNTSINAPNTSTDRPGAVLPAAPPLARSSGSINMFHSRPLLVQLAVATRLVPSGQHSAAAT